MGLSVLRVYSCLTTQHDYRLVLLAAVICISAAALAVKLLHQIAEGRRRDRQIWLIFAATVTGTGVWATHFLAMMAFRPGLPVGYDVALTAISLIVAIAVIGMGFALATSGANAARAARGGGVAGLGVGLMHYLGMAGFRTEGQLIWDVGMVAASLVIGVAGGAAALVLAAKARRNVRRSIYATAALTLAICGLHFVGMASLSIMPDGQSHLPASSLPAGLMALYVSAAAVALLILGAAVLYLEHRQAEARRRQELADTAVEGLLVCHRDTILTANASFLSLAGMTEAQAQGRKLADVFDEDVIHRLNQGEQGFEAALRTADGEPIPVELVARPLTHTGREKLGVAVRDLRARRLADARIRFLAHYDALTGILNRASFNDHLDHTLERNRRKADSLAVLCLDLDRFKPINDLFGHAAGDAVLKAISERIAAELGENDVLARLGGDEFAIVHAGDSRPTIVADLCDRIMAATAREIDIGEGRTARVGVSVGIAFFPSDGQGAEQLLHAADAALYEAKSQGRAAYCFFEPAIGQELRARQELEVDLRAAISRNELKLVYQPQVSMATGEVFGFEALLRWTHPQRGEVPPAEFIPVAEETGVILQIGEWVLRQACAEAASWPKPLQIAVNLSGAQLQCGKLQSSIVQTLFDTGLAPSRLELEITETALISDLQHALKVLRDIKALGVKVAMDDFGTGYSSLSNLRAFPFDKIKIDRSFVRNVHTSEQAATIVRSILGLARGLNLNVIAEGVETPEELAFLQSQACGEAQGYHFGRPGDMSDFADVFDGAGVVQLAERQARRA